MRQPRKSIGFLFSACRQPVKEIHGYEAALERKLLKPSYLSSMKRKTTKGKAVDQKREAKSELAHA
jgi:hypothetical protein